MTYYQKGYEYDENIRNLKKQISDLQEINKTLLKKHTDLKSRELYVRHQEKQLSETLWQINHANKFIHLKRIIQKHDILKQQWDSLLVFAKLVCDEDDMDTLIPIINDKLGSEDGI